MRLTEQMNNKVNEYNNKIINYIDSKIRKYFDTNNNLYRFKKVCHSVLAQIRINYEMILHIQMQTIKSFYDNTILADICAQENFDMLMDKYDRYAFKLIMTLIFSPCLMKNYANFDNGDYVESDEYIIKRMELNGRITKLRSYHGDITNLS